MHKVVITCGIYAGNVAEVEHTYPSGDIEAVVTCPGYDGQLHERRLYVYRTQLTADMEMHERNYQRLYQQYATLYH